MNQVIQVRWVAELIIVSYVSYRIFLLSKGTSFFSALKFLTILFAVAALSNFTGLREMNVFWKIIIFSYVGGALIVFQPELRRLYVNRTYHRGGSSGGFLFQSEENRSKLIDEIALACQTLSRKRIGGLMILERDNSLRDFVQTGISIDAIFTSEVAFSVFLTDSPLHDGAVIIRENRIIAAGCILPLAERVEVRKLVGTRHRAGIGITEQTDALAVVVSEETGKVSIAVQGRMAWDVEIGALKKMLKILYRKV
ncbi:MAG: DNA integrity scanning protein DisA nucleotide-binding domain protein [Candidatus Atribacteria bacterium]|nr:DNA integrity scanning protein DisA nucleotide-binding domain protein [Candidatus Atribacteria bacterium]